MFQITEDDLAILEQEIPRLLDAANMTCNDPIHRKRWEAVKVILSNVRWGYGPPLSVERIEL
jgi:hypothetical protein